eukprot:m.237611 g.237611  ORF g.237611 m.237611 type:complete len:1401 (-) comp18957_c0_seq3:248-4450(-)
MDEHVPPHVSPQTVTFADPAEALENGRRERRRSVFAGFRVPSVRRGASARRSSRRRSSRASTVETNGSGPATSGTAAANGTAEETPVSCEQQQRAYQKADAALNGRTTLASMWTFFGFFYLNPLMRAGYNGNIDPKAFVPLPSRHSSRRLAEKLEEAWKTSPGLWAFAKAFRSALLPTTFCIGIEAACQVGQTLFLTRIVRELSSDDVSASSLYYDALGMCLVAAVRTTVLHLAFFEAWRLGMEMRSASISMLYRKALSVSKQSLARITVGLVVNLCSNDVERFIEANIFSHFLWIAPVQTAVVLYLLWQEIGWAALVGLSAITLSIPIQFSMSHKFTQLRRATADITDIRVKTMNEILTGIQVLKMYAWEKPFRGMVGELRSRELVYIRRTNFVRAFNLSIFFVSMTLSAFLSFLAYDLSGNDDLDATKAFTTLALIGSLRIPLTFNFANAVLLLGELRVTASRIAEFMALQPLPSKHENLHDQEHGKESLYTGGLSAPAPLPPPANDAAATAAFDIKNLSCAWIEDKPVLADVNLKADHGDLVAVVGPVGAGKSTLLNVLLHEIIPDSGHVDVDPEAVILYASQEPWIVSVTVRENIVFGGLYDADWYQQVVKACQMEKDIESFEDGHDTQIGERGITLSGGQKARLGLARAVYACGQAADTARPRIVLLDDPLSAVDPHVGEALFRECIQGLLGNATVVLVTHQVQFAKSADQVLSLTADGKAEVCRNFEEMAAQLSEALDDPADALDEDDARLPAEADSKQRQQAQEEGDPQQPKVLHQQETTQEGSVAMSTYLGYMRAAGGILTCCLLLLLFCVAQANMILADWFLSYWLNLEPEDREDYHLGIYGGLALLYTILAFSRAFLFMFLATKGSQQLHDGALAGILKSPMKFFDTQPIGRILNRFSKDLGYIDETLPWTLLDFLQLFILVSGVLILVSSINPWLFLLLIPVVTSYWGLRMYYVRTSRQLKRLEAVERSPVYAHLSTTLSGLPVIRAHPGATDSFRDTFHTFQDSHTRLFFLFVATSRWLGARLDMITFIFIVGTTFGAIAARDTLSPGEVGLSLVYVLQLTGLFQWCVRQSAEVENHMTSVERVLEYTLLEDENDVVGTDAEPQSPPASWPADGTIEFRNVQLRYAVDLPPVLNNLSFTIASREKIGIVGRTGAGKSTLLAALFRLAPTTGDILLSGIPTHSVPLSKLREAISVIPQDPVLYSTTVRRNLDPFGEISDADLWAALADVQLQQVIQGLPNGLDSEVTEGGANLSVGQRQLVCLARAVLRSSRVLVLDEATANVDHKTDALIQATIREKFTDCTVLVIAHRLHTIMDSDRILVMDAGHVAEFDAPARLLEQGGLFADMVHKADMAMHSTSISGQTSTNVSGHTSPLTLAVAHDDSVLTDV